LTLADMTHAVHGVFSPDAPGSWSPPRAPGFEPLDAFFREADAMGLEVLRRTRWLDLAILVRPGLAHLEPAPPPSPLQETGSGNP
jgi:membrane protein